MQCQSLPALAQITAQKKRRTAIHLTLIRLETATWITLIVWNRKLPLLWASSFPDDFTKLLWPGLRGCFGLTFFFWLGLVRDALTDLY